MYIAKIEIQLVKNAIITRCRVRKIRKISTASNFTFSEQSARNLPLRNYDHLVPSSKDENYNKNKTTSKFRCLSLKSTSRTTWSASTQSRRRLLLSSLMLGKRKHYGGKLDEVARSMNSKLFGPIFD